jgi:hypothetical protein
VLPNPQSILFHSLPDFVSQYASSLGVQSSWRFFAPNPAIRRYLDIEVIPFDNEEESYFVQWPPEDREKYWSNAYSRRLYHSIKTSASEELVETYFKPWFCREHPKAHRFVVNVINHQVPHIEQAQLEESENSFVEMEDEWSASTVEFECEEGE